MEYMMAIHEGPDAWAARKDSSRREEYWASWMAYIQAIRQAGIVKAGNGLEPPETSTTVRLRDSRRQVQDGPFADTKEQLGGFFVIEVPDLDTALDWAARCPAAAGGAVELRPVMVMRQAS